MATLNKQTVGALRPFSLWGLGGTLIIFTVGLCVNPISANDLFWQLRTGHEIVATHYLPHQDTYSWTRRGTPWVVHEWLAFVLLWQAYSWGHGLAGVWLLEVVLAVLTAVVLFACVWRETDGTPLTALLLTAGALLLTSIFFQPRPHMFTYLFFTVTVGVIQAVRRHAAPWQWLLILPPLFALWANLHAGVLVGVGIVVLFALAEASGILVQSDAFQSDARVGECRMCLLWMRRWGLIAAACAFMTLLTPYGWHVYQNFGATVSNATAMNNVSEWASPDFHEMPGKMLECFLLIIGAGFIFSRQRRETVDLLLLLALIYATLGAYRNMPLLALGGTLLGARHVQSALESVLNRLGGTSLRSPSLFGKTPSPVMLGVTGCAFALIPFMRAQHLFTRPDAGNTFSLDQVAATSVGLNQFPEAACRFMQVESFPTTLRLYNDYDIGGFLIWRLPEYPVFIDGRADVYFGSLLDDFVLLKKQPYDWHQILGRYHPGIALFSTQSSQAHLFLSASDWALVYADSRELDEKGAPNFLIFVKRTPESSVLIARSRRACAAWSALQKSDLSRQYAALR